MYINFDILNSSKLSVSNYMLLQACYQNRTENLESYIVNNWNEKDLDLLEQGGLIEYIKGSKKASKASRARTSKKGNSLLENLNTAEITSDDLKIFDWLEATYVNSGREIGNKKKTKIYIALFRANSQIDRNNLSFLIKSFLSNDEQMKYSYRLEYLFFKPANLFQVKFDIDQSRLYQFYLKNEEDFKRAFEKLK